MSYYEGMIPEVTEENLKRWKDHIGSQPYCVVYALIKELETYRAPQMRADAELGALVRRMHEHIEIYKDDDEYGPPDYVQVGTRNGQNWDVTGWYEGDACRTFFADIPEEAIRKALGEQQ